MMTYTYVILLFVQGAYTIVLKIISYDTNPHALFACLNFTLRVKETDQMLAKPPIQGQYEFDHL